MAKCKECNDKLNKKEEDFGMDTCFACIHFEVNGMNRLTDDEGD